MRLTRKVDGNSISLLEGTNTIFTMKETREDMCMVVTLEGSMKSDVEYDFKDEMMMLIFCGLDLKLDFSKVDYLSPSCARVLLYIQQEIDKRERGSLVLSKMPIAILKELESTGLSELLMIED